MSECYSKSSEKLNVLGSEPAEPAPAQGPLGDVSAWEGLGRASVAIHGMWCASCAAAVEAALKKQPGVLKAGVSFAGESARVEWDPARTTLRGVLEAAAGLGYSAGPIAEVDRRYAHITRESADIRRRIMVSIPPALWVLCAGWLPVESARSELLIKWSMAAAALVVFFYGGALFLKMGWRTLRVGVPGMDFLISLGSASALTLSLFNLVSGRNQLYFDGAVFIVLFLLAGRYIEHQARRSSANVLHTLLAESPPRASFITEDGKEVRVDVKTLELDAQVRIRAGERVPVDGVVERGEAHLDKSLITGESRPESVRQGSRVIAGSINLDGDLVVRSTTAFGNRRIDAVSDRMEQLLAEQSSYEALASAAARHLVPLVLVLGAATLVYCWLVLGSMTEGLVRAVSVIVVTCPCALGLATPLALLVSTGRAASMGVSFRDGESLEQLAKVNAVLFDKTGTLTRGNLAVREVVPSSAVSPELVRRAAAIAETGSVHPIAQAVLRNVDSSGFPHGSTRTVPGQGVEWSSVDASREIVVGSTSFFNARGIDIDAEFNGDSTVVHVAENGRWLGSMLLDDELRPDAERTISRLRKMGMKIAMLTGDNSGSALKIAGLTGLEKKEVHFDLSPEQKADRIQEMRSKGYRTAFVGEGLNDGPALAAADVGIAVQGACDLALRSAPLVLQHGGLNRVVDAIKLSRLTLSTMFQNLGFAVLYNAVAIPAAVLGFLQPVFAGAAMAASSLSVTLNSLRLKTLRIEAGRPESK